MDTDATDTTEQSSPYGYDDAAGLEAAFPEVTQTINKLASRAISDDEQIPEQIENHERLLSIPVPTETRGLVPFAYQRALLNRIRSSRLTRREVCDIDAYKPTFVHDILMLPGSLANLLGKRSPEDVLHRMTPALLSDVHAHIDRKTLLPRLIHSGRSTDYVQGMLVFGQGKKARNIIHQHYMRNQRSRRKRVSVEIEVLVPVPLSQRATTDDLYCLERRRIEAHAWLDSRIEECSISDGTEDSADPCQTWHIEDYLTGKLEPEAPLRIEPSAKGDEDEDGYIRRDTKEFDFRFEQREVVLGRGGTLDYERARHFTGW